MYSQRDSKWAKIPLGFSKKYTIGSDGCKVTAFANIDGRTPKELNELFKNNNCFFADSTGDICLLDDRSAAKALNWDFEGRITTPTKKCIMEVKWNGYQHFVVWLPSGDIIDSWDGKEKPLPNNYKPVSYRVFDFNQMDKELKELADKKGIEDLEDALRLALEYKKERNEFKDKYNKEKEDRKEAEKSAEAMTNAYAELNNKLNQLESYARSLEVRLKDDTSVTLIAENQELLSKIQELSKTIDIQKETIEELERSRNYEVMFDLGIYKLIKIK